MTLFLSSPSIRIVLALFLALGGLTIPGCRRGPAEDEASIRESLAGRTGAQILSEAEKTAYAPPKDGRLTENQIEMYLAVKRREGQIRAVLLKDLRAAGAPRPGEGPRGEAGALATAGMRAAQELSYNPREYRWVEDRVLEAELAAAGHDMAERLEAGRKRYLERLEARRRAATDSLERAEIERRIAEFRRRAGRASPGPTPVAQYNAELLARYRAQLDQVRAQLAGPAGERSRGPRPRAGTASRSGGPGASGRGAQEPGARPANHDAVAGAAKGNR